MFAIFKKKMARSEKSQSKRPWQDVAKEAQKFRDASLARVPGIDEVFGRHTFSDTLLKDVTAIPRLVMNESDVQITESLPEKLVEILAKGKLPATDVTLAFLRRAAGSETEMPFEVRHPRASVIFTEYVPGNRATAVEVIWPALHRYVYGLVPPEGVAVAVPSPPPLHVTSVLLIELLSTAGSNIVTPPVSVAPQASSIMPE